MKKPFAYFFILILSTFSSLGHAQPSQIKCLVIDQKTGEVLPGATIQIVGSANKTATISDLNGMFSFSDNLKKDQLIRISYVGYQSQEVPFSSLKSSKEIQMAPVSQNIEEVSVTGQADGQTKALLDQKNAVNIKNVVSQEQIEQFPDLNAAETLQRIPGITLQRDKGEGKYIQLRGTPPEYTSFNINGEQIPSPEAGVRYIGLDVISSDQIEFIEVNKVLTPDMDADGIGGSVNVITKSAKSEKPEISASLSGGYSNLRQSPNYQGQFSIAQRVGKFGISINSNYYLNNYGADNLEIEYTKGPLMSTYYQELEQENFYVHYEEFQLRHYNIKRERRGLSATVDYQLNESSKFYIRGMYNGFTDHQTRRRVIYTLDDPVTETYYLYGGIERDLKDRTKNQSISSFNAGGEHKIGRITIDYEGAYSVAKEDVPDRVDIAFDNPGQAIYMEFDISDTDYPAISFPDSSNAINATNYNEYDLEELSFETELTTDINITGKFNLKIPYKTEIGNGYLKFGGKTRHKTKEKDKRTTVYTEYYFEDVPNHTGTGPEFLLPELYDGFSESNLLNHGYLVDWTPGPDETRDFFEFYPQHFYLHKTKSKQNTYGEDYLAHEHIYSAYGMFRHDINNLMLIGGVRLEYTEIDYTGNEVILHERFNYFLSLEELKDKRSHRFILPQFQARYRYRNTNFRAAVTQSFSRPNFEDVLPYNNVERKKIEMGNPDLKFPHATNYDLMVENYGKSGANFSASLFYKRIDDFIYYYRIRWPYAGDRTLFTQSLNGDYANVYGSELNGQFKFVFLPGILKNFGLFFNYTYTHSEAYTKPRFAANEQAESSEYDELMDYLNSLPDTLRITLPGQARHTLNLALFYESPKLYLKLSANYHDDFLSALGEDEDLDEYYASALHLDFNANYSITNSLKIFADVKNLTNAPLKYYMGSPDKIQKLEYYSWWFRIGLRLKIN